MANNTIQLKRTSTTGRTPNTTSSANTQYINAGELALNMTDGILYSSNGTTLITVGANQVNQSVTGTLTVNAISANASTGTSGQFLTSNGGGLYWSTSSGGGTTLVKQSFTGDGTTTTFTVTGGYTSNNLQVFVGGTLMRNGTDANVSSGSSVVFAAAPANNQLIDVWGVSALYANTISSTVSQQFTANGTANSFTITNGYVPSAVSVYLNGVKQIPGTDVIITSGNTVNFTVTPANNYIVDVFGYQTTVLGNLVMGNTTITTANVTTDNLYTTGNIGIGVTAPSYRIHARANNTTATNWITSDNQTATGGYGAGFLAIAANGTNYSYMSQGADGNQYIINALSTGSIIMQAGGAERMRIDSSGNMGIGVTPNAWSTVTALQMAGPSMWGSSGVGHWSINTYFDGTNYKYINTGAVTDYYQLSGAHVWRYAASGTAGANVSFSEAMRIAANGSIGIGTTTPSRPLEVNGYIVSSGLTQYRQDTVNEGGQIELCAANNNAIVWNIDVYGSTTTPALRVFNASAVGVTLVSGATAWTTMSDINLKTDLQPIENAVDTLKDIRCVTYRFKDIDEPDSKRRIGIIAQDIVGKVDEALDHAQMKNDPNDYLSVRYTELVPHLIKAIQELSAKNTDLEARLKALENAGQ